MSVFLLSLLPFLLVGALTLWRIRSDQWVEMRLPGRLPGGARFYFQWPDTVPDHERQAILHFFERKEIGERYISLPAGVKIFRPRSELP